jgi:hypothetical protein
MKKAIPCGTTTGSAFFGSHIPFQNISAIPGCAGGIYFVPARMNLLSLPAGKKLTLVPLENTRPGPKVPRVPEPESLLLFVCLSPFTLLKPINYS